MKKSFIAFFFVAFFFQAVGQQYYITETQLQELEAICQSYKVNNQKQQEQLQKLQSKAESLEKNSKSLKEQLQAERKTTESLNRSLTEYENKCSRSEADKIQLLLDLDKQKLKTTRWKNIAVVFIFVCTGLIAIDGFLVYKKFR